MDRYRSLQGQGQASSSSTTRVDRKTLEKNRRNKMKHLYSILNSLLPNQDPKEPKPLPDQIDDAVNHIRCLEASIKEAKEKKETLKGKKRLHHCSSSSSSRTTNNTLHIFKEPKIEVRVRGCSLEVTLVTAVSDKFIFTDIVRILHEEKTEVVNANFSINGSSVHHLIHAQIDEYGDGGATITERLKKLVNGSADDDEYYNYIKDDQPEFLVQEQPILVWNDFEIDLELWDFGNMPGLGYSCN